MSIEPAVRLDSVSKIFPGAGRQGQTVALGNISLTIPSGQFLAVVGESGCGKSTLINLIAGFMKTTTGRVRVFGEEVERAGPDRLVVFQDYALLPWFTALGNVAYGLARQGLPSMERNRIAMDALSRMGLKDFAHAYPAALSGGMRQRVALARALVMKPKILLLDEPFASLDAMTRARLQDELLDLWRENEWTIVFVTHTTPEAIYLADRLVVLDRPPAGIRLDMNIDIARPRSRRDAVLLNVSDKTAALIEVVTKEKESESCVCSLSA
jgi:NitT/TauT family transport system ATP-binding protein